MGNILQKRIKLKKKEHKILTRILGVAKGAKVYILRRDGTTKPFTILAEFGTWFESFNKFRHSKTIAFACYQDEEFTPFNVSRTMRKIVSIATHLAVVLPSEEAQVYTIRNGDDWLPYYEDSAYTLFVTPTTDAFVLEDNQE